MLQKVILSLCDFTGNWSKPYREDDSYKVITVDIKHGQDVRLFHKPEWQVHGILAAPPCTMFSSAGARWKRSRDEIKHALSIVDACCRFALICSPKWWVLENPVGTLTHFLGPPRFWMQPFYYGDPYTKKTGLWGNFNIPPLTNMVAPSETAIVGRKGKRMSNMHNETFKLPPKQRATVRSTTPLGFSYAFFKANP